MASKPQNAQKAPDKTPYQHQNYQRLSERPSHDWNDKTSSSMLSFEEAELLNFKDLQHSSFPYAMYSPSHYHKRQLDKAMEEYELVAKKKTMNPLNSDQLEIPTRPQYEQKKKEKKEMEAFNEKETLHPDTKNCQKHNAETACEKAKIDDYLEKRRKNNASAKKSREARRQRELENQIRVSYLEDENSKLRSILCVLRNENIQLRELLIM